MKQGHYKLELLAANKALRTGLEEIMALEPSEENTEFMQGRAQGIAEAQYFARAAIAKATGEA